MKTILATLAVSIFAVAIVCGVAAGESEAAAEAAQNGIPLIVIRVDEQELHQTTKGN
ncbi:MAG: hypothetical protein IIY55_12105 [Blautia sp.]|nr:hypothetical protein [Blautia sp.]